MKIKFCHICSPLQKYFGPPLENALLAPPWKKSFWPSCLGVHAHLLKCWRGSWTEKVWNPCSSMRELKWLWHHGIHLNLSKALNINAAHEIFFWPSGAQCVTSVHIFWCWRKKTKLAKKMTWKTITKTIVLLSVTLLVCFFSVSHYEKLKITTTSWYGKSSISCWIVFS